MELFMADAQKDGFIFFNLFLSQFHGALRPFSFEFIIAKVQPGEKPQTRKKAALLKGGLKRRGRKMKKLIFASRCSSTDSLIILALCDGSVAGMGRNFIFQMEYSPVNRA